jgi:hypothetical protein
MDDGLLYMMQDVVRAVDESVWLEDGEEELSIEDKSFNDKEEARLFFLRGY